MKFPARTLALALLVLAAFPAASSAQPGMPPDDPDSWKLAGTAKVLCSALFVSGRDSAEAHAHVSNYFLREKTDSISVVHIDRRHKLVRLTLAGRISREAKLYGDQGCVIHQPGRDSVYFTPVPVTSKLPDAATTPWPMGDLLPTTPLPRGLDTAKLRQATDAAFADPAGLTAGFVVVHRGRIVAERYGNGANRDMQLESWSMGKSITGTLVGMLVHQGAFKLEDPAPVPEWQKTPGDPRAKIRVIDLLRMSSGLRFSRGSPEDLPGYHDHDLIYTGAIDAFQFSVTRQPQFPPNTRGRYRNVDVMTLGLLIRDAVKQRGEEYLTWPQRALFDKIGIRRQVLETDPYGNFLLSGYDYGTSRNWARLGMLYLNDGVWNGERLLPEGWTKLVSSPAPAWADSSYGGMVWVNARWAWPLPRDAFAFSGAGGQETYVVPSLDLVVVRQGHFPGAQIGRQDLRTALRLIAEAVQERPGLAITGVGVVDVERGRVIPNQTVMVQDGRITSVTAAGRAAIPAGTRAIDGSRRYLIPGLWDMHAHLHLSGNPVGIELPLFVAHGVTGVRVMGADQPSVDPAITRGLDQHRELQSVIAAGTLIGPRLLALASWAVNGTSGISDSMPRFYRATTREEGRQLARHFKARGFDFIKIYNNVSREGYLGLAEEARTLGLPFAGHEPAALSAIELSNAGQKSLEHSRIFLLNCFPGADSLQKGLLAQTPATRRRQRMVDEYDPKVCAEVFRVFAKNGTWITPTHGTRKMDAFADDSAYRRDARLKYLPMRQRMAWNADANGMVGSDSSRAGRKSFMDFYTKGLAITRDAYRAGVPLMVGTDAGDSFVFPGSSVHDELDELVKAGLTPAEALRAATLSGARFLGRASEFGTVEPGRAADLVLLDGNPLDDIRNTRRIHAVVLAGRPLERGQLDSLLLAVEVRARPDAQTRLAAAAVSGDTVEIVAALAAGARIDSLSENRRPLNHAALNNRPAAIRVLLSRGAGINLPNGTGFTPVHHAAEVGALDALATLIAAGADLTIKTSRGMLPIDVARGQGREGAVRLLEASAKARPAPPQAASYFPPRGEWARKAPAEVGLNAALVDSAIAFAKASESGTTRDLEKAHWESGFGREPFPEPLGQFKPRGDMSGIIVRNGYIVAEWGEPERVDLTFSVTKSFLSSTAGLAWDRKMIPDLNAKVKELITTGEFDSEHNAKITWDHMLRQTSDWEGTLWSKPDWSDRPPANTPIEEYRRRVRNEPGTAYKYNDVRVNMLGLALLKLWKRPLPEVLREHVMDPIGASNTWEWHGYRNSTVEIDGKPMLSVGGGAHWGGGMWISAQDQARFGLLTLHRGVWDRRRILSDAWIAQALTPTTPQPTYGFMNYFLNTGKRQWPSAPESTFCHLGNGTNAVCVLPDYDMVVVLRWIRGNAVDGVLKRLIEAVRPVPNPGAMQQ